MTWHDAAPYLPHDRCMRFIDSVSDEGVEEATALIRDDNPFLIGNILPSWVGIEYMAQAVAAKQNLQSGRCGSVRSGVIASIKDIKVAKKYLHSSLPITVRIEILLSSDEYTVAHCFVWQEILIVSAILSIKEN